MSATQFFAKTTSKFPSYWKLATVRCCIYATIVGWSSFDAGVEGYERISDISSLNLLKLFGHIMVAMMGVWVAFLDQTMAGLRKPTDQTTPDEPAPTT